MRKLLILSFLFISSLNSFSQVRITYIIKNKEGKTIGKRVTLAEFMDELPSLRIIDIYILDDGRKYLEKYFYCDKECSEARDKAKRKAIGIGKLKDSGVESMTRIKIKISNNFYEFNLYGDITYIYIKDENGNILKDEDALSYIINKNENIKEFFEIMAYESKKCLQGLKYIFYKKKVAKKLDLISKKYNIERKNFPCTEVEKELGYDCSKYNSFTGKVPCRRL